MNSDRWTIFDVLYKRSEAAPEADAIVEAGIRLSNRDLLERVDATAQFLLSRGIGKGDRVSTLAPPGLDFWITFLAATSIGAIWQGLNPAYRETEFTHLLDDASPSLVFAHGGFGGRNYFNELAELLRDDSKLFELGAVPLDPADPRLALPSPASGHGLNAARRQIDPEDAAVIVYTSGTTGRPKGAMLSHRAIVQTALSNLAWMPAEGLQSTICASPINHVGGLNNVCFTVFAGGGRIIFVPRVDLVELARVNAQEQPTYLVGSPTAWAMMIAAGVDFSAADFYRLIVFGGAPSTVAQLTEVAKTGARMSSVYGQTETTGMMTYNETGASLEVMSETIGQPIPGNEIRIADAEGQECTTGEIGEIQIRGVSVMSGYWRNPEATRDAFTRDGWLKSGDLGVRREDGNIVFSGRLKEMFKSGGYNVYPVEVELAICEHRDVIEAAVIERPHDTFQEVGHAFYVTRPGTDPSASELTDFLRSRMAAYKIPKTWQRVDAFPRLPNGKTDKRALRGMIEGAS